MGRVLAVDYGKKRTGLAVTDILRITANPLQAIATHDLKPFLKNYLQQEDVDEVVIGWPTHADGTPTEITSLIKELEKYIKKIQESISICYVDESYTSSEAKSIILTSGAKKKKRRDKSLVDLISAVLILQRHLNHI